MTDTEPFCAGDTGADAQELAEPEPGQQCRDPEQLLKLAVAAIWRRFRSGELYSVPLCRAAVNDIREYRDAVVKNTEHLLRQIGIEARCKGCKALVYWVRHSNDKRTAYTTEGLNHFVDCPNREDFRKPKA